MILDCLIVKEKWLNMILDGHKSLEIRGVRTHKRGLIGLIQSGTGEVKGIASLTDCRKLDKKDFVRLQGFHQIKDKEWEELPYKNVYGWKMEKRRRLRKPVKYNHPRGAVIWVKVDIPEEVLYGKVEHNK